MHKRTRPSPEARRRTTPYLRATMTRYCQVSSDRPSVGQPTGRGGGCLILDDHCTKTGRPVAEVLQEKHSDMRVSPVENPTCASFEEYEKVPETVPLDFTEDDVTWVASKISGAAGALGAEAMELGNWLVRFVCASKELRVVVARPTDWMANSPPLGRISRTDGMSPSVT